MTPSQFFDFLAGLFRSFRPEPEKQPARRRGWARLYEVPEAGR